MLAPEDIRVQNAGVVLGATGVAGGVVEVRQAEVVAVLVREDAEAAVLGLDGVVADPDAGRVVRALFAPLVERRRWSRSLTPGMPPGRRPAGCAYQRWLQIASVP